MKKMLKRALWVFAIVTLVATLFYGFKCEDKPIVLNVLARLYFDKDYYLKTYPDIKKAGVDPFEHYMTTGWRESRNPRADFDTAFYQRVYFGCNESKIGLAPLQYHLRGLLHFKTELTHPSDLKKAIPLKNPKYYLTLVAVFRDEAPYLKEWIEFYRLQGVEHFYLFNHLSQDHYKEILAPYIKEGVVELMDVVTEPATLKEWNKLQTSLYDKTAKASASDAEWLIIADTDEFFYPLQGGTLKEALQQYDDVPCLSVSWQLFGSGNLLHLDATELMIDKLRLADGAPDRQVKSIVKPRYVVCIDHPHFPKLKKGYAQADENHVWFNGPFAPSASKTKLKINHYWARDWTFFKERKLSRVHIVEKDLSPEAQQKKTQELVERNHLYSTKPETDILRFVPALKKRMGFASPSA